MENFQYNGLYPYINFLKIDDNTFLGMKSGIVGQVLRKQQEGYFLQNPNNLYICTAERVFTYSWGDY